LADDGPLPVPSDSPSRRNRPPGPPSAALPWWISLAAILLTACLAATVSWRLHHPPAIHYVPRPDHPRGTFREVQEVVPPLSLRLDDGTLVRLAGIARPQTPEESERVEAHLRDLVPPGTLVYVEPEPVRTTETDTGKFASVYLPPPDTGRAEPFPYAKARLLNAILVQDGLVREEGSELYRYSNEFEMLEHDARQHERGLWGPAS
jgi:hypothetical protein